MSDIYDYLPRIIASARLPVVVLEIGVGRGEDTGRMVDYIIAQGKPYRYFAFEAEAKNIEAIQREVGNKVLVVPVAVGDRNARVPWIGSGSWPLSGSVKQPKEHLKSYPWIPWAAPVEVEMVRLDDYLAPTDVGEVAFIWMDVQGAEDLVIAGAQEVLKRTRFAYTEFYESTEYEGQIGLEEIHRRLPGKWEVVCTWAGDLPNSGNVLFRNLAFSP